VVSKAEVGGLSVSWSFGGISDGDTITLAALEARRRGLKIKFVRHIGDDYPRAIDLVS
jgi:L-iditol 2-dehydrogenase